jgi:hypothetical protein
MIISEVKSANLSAKYVAISSQKLINDLQSKGFELSGFQAKKKGAKSSAHLIRMRYNKELILNGETLYPEVVIRNSFDGTVKFECAMGIFRLVCSNGLTVSDSRFESKIYKVRHFGKNAMAISEKVISGEIVANFFELLPKLEEYVLQQMSVNLTEEKAIEFAMKAAALRFKRAFTENEARLLLVSERFADDDNTLWAIQNRLQEKLINGFSFGMAGGRRYSALKDPNKTAIINEKLANLSMEFAN